MKAKETEIVNHIAGIYIHKFRILGFNTNNISNINKAERFWNKSSYKRKNGEIIQLTSSALKKEFMRQNKKLVIISIII